MRDFTDKAEKNGEIYEKLILMCFWNPYLYLNKEILIDLAVKACSAVKRSHADQNVPHKEQSQRLKILYPKLFFLPF